MLTGSPTQHGLLEPVAAVTAHGLNSSECCATTVVKVDHILSELDKLTSELNIAHVGDEDALVDESVQQQHRRCQQQQEQMQQQHTMREEQFTPRGEQPALRKNESVLTRCPTTVGSASSETSSDADASRLLALVRSLQAEVESHAAGKQRLETLLAQSQKREEQMKRRLEEALVGASPRRRQLLLMSDDVCAEQTFRQDVVTQPDADCRKAVALAPAIPAAVDPVVGRHGARESFCIDSVRIDPPTDWQEFSDLEASYDGFEVLNRMHSKGSSFAGSGRFLPTESIGERVESGISSSALEVFKVATPEGSSTVTSPIPQLRSPIGSPGESPRVLTPRLGRSSRPQKVPELALTHSARERVTEKKFEAPLQELAAALEHLQRPSPASDTGMVFGGGTAAATPNETADVAEGLFEEPLSALQAAVARLKMTSSVPTPRLSLTPRLSATPCVSSTPRLSPRPTFSPKPMLFPQPCHSSSLGHNTASTVGCAVSDGSAANQRPPSLAFTAFATATATARAKPQPMNARADASGLQEASAAEGLAKERGSGIPNSCANEELRTRSPTSGGDTPSYAPSLGTTSVTPSTAPPSPRSALATFFTGGARRHGTGVVNDEPNAARVSVDPLALRMAFPEPAEQEPCPGGKPMSVTTPSFGAFGLSMFAPRLQRPVSVPVGGAFSIK